MKINLGSGHKRYDGWTNVDDDPLVKPDYLVNLEKDKLPFDDNSVDEIRAYHILEHIGEGFIPLMQEIYRVCKDGAIIDVRVPHHLSDIFWGDPTHKRPILVEGMKLFSKKFILDHIEKYGSSNGMAIKYNVDFEVIWHNYIHDEMYQNLLNDFFSRKEQGKTTIEEEFNIQRLFREANNTTIETQFKMMVIK